MRVLVFGDSIGQGYWDVDGGWVDKLRKHYDQLMVKDWSEHTTIFNLGVSADTTQDVLDRIKHETEARKKSGNNELAIVLAIGINDSILINERAFMDVYEFQETYEKLIEQAQKLSDRVLCVGLTAVDEERTTPVSWRDIDYMNNRINLFEDAIKQVAIQNDIPFVGTHDAFLAELEKGKDLLVDGLHPNNHGHELIAKIIQPAIEDLTSG